MSEAARPISIYVDADACPVKNEIYRVAERHGLKTFVVSNSFIAVPRTDLIERVIVGSGPDAADDWIAERAVRGDIVVTNDVPLASRCIKAGAQVLGSSGREFTESWIGMALATRNLMDELRSAGEITRGPKPFSAADRSRFLDALHRAIVRLKRESAQLPLRS
ncbi:MAG: YaiI/YqxD family protein [Methylobacteriaceae bacterium]|nr:YaiI/YqxD family protein [Methylobacteriaceae bacterium]MBV9395451.1 YaiI/YqxD family protein [Methylobacteriaceae bacterium]